MQGHFTEPFRNVCRHPYAVLSEVKKDVSKQRVKVGTRQQKIDYGVLTCGLGKCIENYSKFCGSAGGHCNSMHGHVENLKKYSVNIYIWDRLRVNYGGVLFNGCIDVFLATLLCEVPLVLLITYNSLTPTPV